jgi:hypothetical protein
MHTLGIGIFALGNMRLPLLVPSLIPIGQVVLMTENPLEALLCSLDPTSSHGLQTSSP